MQKVIPTDAILIPDKAKRVFKGVIYEVCQWDQENFDDSVVTFEMLRRPDTVSAICITDDSIIILDDEQPHRGSRATFPGGRVDDTDESTLFAAKREVMEETGYEFASWKLVEVTQPQDKLEWFVYTYVAWNVVSQKDTSHEPGERIKLELKSLDEVKRLAASEVDFIGDSRKVLQKVTSLEALKNLPEFKGKSYRIDNNKIDLG